MLRGINVSGQKIIKMAELAGLYESLKFADARTYIQSGNVVFKSDQSDPQKLELRIQETIERKFGFLVTVIIRTQNDLRKIIVRNPFIGSPEIDTGRLHVTFLGSEPDRKLADLLTPDIRTKDEFKFIGREIYLYCPDGYGKTRLSNSYFEKQLKVSATTRNWNTVNRLYEMSKE
jgi:uncharacterized protein (DUF1697 family)